MRRTLPGEFRVAQPAVGIPPGINLTDNVNTNGTQFGSVWSPGGTIIDRINNLKPQRNQDWSVISVTLQAQLTFVTPGRIYGKIGKLLAALVTDPTVTQATAGPGSGGQPWANPMLPLPQDMTLSVDLWNPVSDPLPPADIITGSATQANALNVTATIAPPVPIDLVSGIDIGVGIWMLPALYGWSTASSVGMGLVVYNARWQVNYDDNL